MVRSVKLLSFAVLFFGFLCGFFDGGEERILDILLFLLRSSFLEDNVDFIASELGGEADVLALLTDSDGLLVLGDVDFGFFAVDFDLCNFGWTEGFTDIFGGIVAPVDDINLLFVADFVHDSLDSNTASAHEGADWVYAGDGRHDGDFGAATGLASDALNFYGIVF